MRTFRVFLVMCALVTAYASHAQHAFPALSGRVVDVAGVLNAVTATTLTEQLKAHESQSSNQIVVATVASLDGYDIADYGVQLARYWGLGTTENNNGVLLLIAPTERAVRIEVGYGLEGALPDALAGDIIRKRILPAFREGDYNAGASAGVRAIIQAIDGEYAFDPNAAATGKRGAAEHLQALIPLLFISIIFVAEAAKRHFNSFRTSKAVVPASFAGLLGLVISENPLIAIAVALGVFGLIFFSAKPLRRRPRGATFHDASKPEAYREHNNVSTRPSGLGGGRNSGGVSGRGGSFGGGGASGNW